MVKSMTTVGIAEEEIIDMDMSRREASTKKKMTRIVNRKRWPNGTFQVYFLINS